MSGVKPRAGFEQAKPLASTTFSKWIMDSGGKQKLRANVRINCRDVGVSDARSVVSNNVCFN